MKIVSGQVAEGVDWMDRTDTRFAEYVEASRKLGYGRMMQIISCVWAEHDMEGSLTVGPARSTVKRRKERCERDGHDWNPKEGGQYKWCDRCGINGEKGEPA